MRTEFDANESFSAQAQTRAEWARVLRPVPRARRTRRADPGLWIVLGLFGAVVPTLFYLAASGILRPL
jgi:hypothetical protein